MTIYFKELGNLGHLGNQMFQYAALRGIAAKHNYEWAIPSKHEFGSRYPLKSSIYEVFQLSSMNIFNTIIPQSLETIEETHFHFDPNIFNNCPDNRNINGYFQSYKYFEGIEDEIIKDFTPKNFKDSQGDYICVHVRRGDYINLPNHHPACSLEYYKNAMEIFGKDKFVILSDDLGWCREQEIFKDCIIPDESSVKDDMSKMINAKSIITANSSFSWWGAWLNKNPDKIVISPERWFGDAYSNYNMEDIRPKEWMRL